jgi:hypothetical protein
MRFEIRLVDLGLNETQLAGRALGDRLYNDAIAPALSKASAETILLLSFRGVEFATGSIFKATWHRLHPEAGVVVPSMVAHLSDDVRAEFAIYLRSERVAGLEALDWRGTEVTLATLHGHFEDSALSALQAVTASAGSTAPKIQSASEEAVSPTAWTNRLNELHRQGLAVRQKAGRAWQFFPLAREVQRG